MFFFPVPDPALPHQKIRGRLMTLAAFFVACLAAALTLAPAVRYHSFEVELRWMHWVGMVVWLASFMLIYRRVVRVLPDSDPYLLPAAALLSGWGLMTIWRLSSDYGARQTVWLVVCTAVIVVGLRFPRLLDFLQRYKYLWLTTGLLLTLLTFAVGVYPGGVGPDLWLNLGGFFLQPSEPLKLLLIIYLAAYLAQVIPLSFNFMQLALPTLALAGISLALLVGQRDLGTASIFMLVYAGVLYTSLGRKIIPVFSLLVLIGAAAAGYMLFDVVRLRVESWLNPWPDPTGRSYQVIQSLISIAAGGVVGSGPGLGSPGLVPVAQSDFIYTAIAEESGLLGSTGLAALIGLFSLRGLVVAVRASSHYQRYLAAGLSILIGVQSLLIIGGNVRLLPLTGVTLPFVSYGGSSLVVSFSALLLLLLISDRGGEDPVPLARPQPYWLLGGLLLVGLGAAIFMSSWWASWRSLDLTARYDNARRSINDRYVQRGSLLDRNGVVLNGTAGEAGGYSRFTAYPPLSPVLGYTHPVYGQAALEVTFDPYLRGTAGYPMQEIWWQQLIASQPPPGQDVRLTLSLSLQQVVDQAFAGHTGAAVLMNAETGEVLAMASHPNFDANKLDEIWDQVTHDPSAPLVNRAVLGYYPTTGGCLSPFETANAITPGAGETVPDGSLIHRLGFDLNLTGFTGPSPVATPTPLPGKVTSAPVYAPLVSPLQMAQAAASFSAGGLRPEPRLALSINVERKGWVTLPAASDPVAVFSPRQVNDITAILAVPETTLWEKTCRADDQTTWYIGGTLATWRGSPFVVVLLLEEDNPELAASAGRSILQAALNP
ncbi:MAG TPA: FtsW/RodA/SpoVE family cell cycle protein [Anaerolineaceae bacterium]|nr:FtsW/RodA/SpoVE family cell cycle protein [Anaerolineaceae bacterium]HPN50760.1 FtsW/RodA/SpoVE family cell cycle protein [Anaerolineaceae bacterium]